MEALDQVFEVVGVENHREDYERALTEWANRLMERRSDAIQVTSDEVVDDYLRYLRMSAKAFRVRAAGRHSRKIRYLTH